MDLNDAIYFNIKTFSDARGSFKEEFNKIIFKKILKRNFNVIQQNVSMSKLGVLRGLHYQTNKAQAKIISVIDGKIFDVIVDLRIRSKSFGRWESFILSSKNKKHLYVPEGFAHGFLSLSNNTKIQYLTNNLWNIKSEKTILWNDPYLNIKWPKIKNKILISKKDKLGDLFLNSKFFK